MAISKRINLHRAFCWEWYCHCGHTNRLSDVGGKCVASVVCESCGDASSVISRVYDNGCRVKIGTTKEPA